MSGVEIVLLTLSALSHIEASNLIVSYGDMGLLMNSSISISPLIFLLSLFGVRKGILELKVKFESIMISLNIPFCFSKYLIKKS